MSAGGGGAGGRFDAIVVGAGAAGAAAAYRLAKAGRRVALLEQFEVGHDRGSSHGASRIIRYTYEHPAYVQLAREAYAAWEELERETGTVLFHRTGDLFFGPAGGPIEVYFETLRAEGIAHERLAPADVERRFPAVRLPPDHVALHQPDGGLLEADECVLRHALRAEDLGAEVREDEPVRAIRTSGADPLVRVETDAGAYLTERLILTAGPWTARLTPDLRLPLRVTRQAVAYYGPKGDASPFRADRLPVWVYVGWEGGRPGEDAIAYYGLPMFGRFGVKAARHGTRNPAVDPDALDRTVRPGELDDVRAFLGRYFPGLADAEAVDPHVCLYTVTPDEHFVIDVHPTDARIVLATACSGHGFKFASAIGRILADLALTGRSTSPAFEAHRAMFSIGRFRVG